MVERDARAGQDEDFDAPAALVRRSHRVDASEERVQAREPARPLRSAAA
jgi:hypothetical protein